MMSIFLLLMGLFINAPLEELANGNVTPAVAKAPWYFLGLQELLAYFHPTVAGVLVPTLRARRRGAHPVRRSRERPRHPAVASARPRSCCSRMFCILGLIVTFVGIFFRGPGYTLRHPVRDDARPPLRPVTASRRNPRRMSNYHVEPVDKPAALTERGDQVAAQAAGPGHLAPAAAARPRSGPAIGLWLLEVTAGHHRRSSGRT